MTLTLDTPVTIQTSRRSAARGEPQTVKGQIVAPGLAITPNPNTPGRYVLTHVDSGLVVPCGYGCADHIVQAARIAAESGVDWTVPVDQFDVAAGKQVSEQIADAIPTCRNCPDGTTQPDPESRDDTPDVRIVYSGQFVAAYDKAGLLAAVKWHAQGVWYVTNGGGPRTFADEQAATKAFLTDAGAMPS